MHKFDKEHIYKDLLSQMTFLRDLGNDTTQRMHLILQALEFRTDIKQFNKIITKLAKQEQSVLEKCLDRMLLLSAEVQALTAIDKGEGYE